MKKDIIFKFANAINRQDLSLITDIIIEDFIFIDTYSGQENKEQIKTG